MPNSPDRTAKTSRDRDTLKPANLQRLNSILGLTTMPGVSLDVQAHRLMLRFCDVPIGNWRWEQSELVYEADGGNVTTLAFLDATTKFPGLDALVL